jgi:NAD(P)-dependent dehydrogenase (short-subunit alcohol dehydrogenase family)
VLALTYFLAQSLLIRGIRVNCVAPGPVWTPLIPATFPEERVAKFGQQTPIGPLWWGCRVGPAQPGGLSAPDRVAWVAVTRPGAGCPPRVRRWVLPGGGVRRGLGRE